MGSWYIIAQMGGKLPDSIRQQLEIVEGDSPRSALYATNRPRRLPLTQRPANLRRQSAHRVHPFRPRAH